MSTLVSKATTTFENEATNMFTWVALAMGETGDKVEFPSYVDRTFQVTGTFGGATIVFEGSNDDATYFTLSDPQGNQLSLTAAGLKQIEEITRYARPRLIGGDGTTALKVVLLARRHPR